LSLIDDIMLPKLEIEVRDSLAGIEADAWNALSGDGNPFLQHEFLHSLDVTDCLGESTGWYPRYFLLWQENKKDEKAQLIAAVATYVKTNSYGEFVFDWAWAEAYERHQLPYYPKLVASIPFTPATGRRFLVRSDQPFSETVTLLASAIRQFAKSQEYSGVHYLFVTERESEHLGSLLSQARHDTDSESEHSPDNSHADANIDTGNEAGIDEKADSSNNNQYEYLEHFPTYLKRIDCQYHWHNNDYDNFDSFLAQCTAKRRKTIKRERRFVKDSGLVLQRRLGSSLSAEEWSLVHDLYESTYDRKWGNPSLTEAFFKRVGDLMGDQVLIIFAYDPNDQLAVACSIMFIGSTTLYGRYWGCRGRYNSLHFEACYYQGIAQGEHKITRGFVPTLTRSAHHIVHTGFREAIAKYLEQERPHIEERCTGLSDLLPFKSTSNLTVND